MRGSINVAIAGVGNCASSLIQGVYFYTRYGNSKSTGVAFKKVGPYAISDIKFVAAFDVDSRKVGKDLSKAIFTEPNNALKIINVEPLNVKVSPGPLLDGIADELKGSFIPVTEGSVDDVVKELDSRNVHILINFLPTGAQKASEAYAESALRTGVAFINAMPANIINQEVFQRKFEKKKIPLAGDDIQNQIGATILHKSIIHLLSIRGLQVENTYQINIGGTPDFVNLMYRKSQKEKSKTEAVKKMSSKSFEAYIAPVAYIPFLESKKIAHILVEAKGFADAPVRIRVDLEVYDPWNNAGIMVDVIRLMKIALDRGVGGPMTSISAWAFKNPIIHTPPDVAYQWVLEFLEGRRER